jgi:hypothetical protein
LLVSWESITDASCANGTCTGHFAGTHLRVVSRSGRTVGPDIVGPDTVVNAHIADGSLVWAFAQATLDDSGPLNGSGPTTTTLTIAHLIP